MSTKNLNLEEINPADYVKPDVINHNMEKIDSLGVDYVTESGKSGKWWYRKWKSGRAECGIDNFSVGDYKCTEWGVLFAGPAIQFGAYPFTFAERPYVSINFTKSDDWNGWAIIRPDGTTSMCPTACIVRSTGGTMPKCFCSIYVNGRIR